MAKKCDTCGRSFKNAHGVQVHKNRTPACGGRKVEWGASSRTPRGGKHRRSTTGETGKQAIRRIVDEHPEGVATKEIRAKLKECGLTFNLNYIAQAIASMHEVVSQGRGVYRLKHSPRHQTGAAVVQSAVAEAKEASGLTLLSRETLLLHIETLEAQYRALKDAHLSLLRGVMP